MGEILKKTESTLWALRHPPPEETKLPEATLYEHLFGYDPIRVVRNHIKDKAEKTAPVSAEEPRLNILNPQTGFMVRELVSDDPTNA